MDGGILGAVVGLVSLIIGLGIGIFFARKQGKDQEAAAKAEAEKLLKDAQRESKHLLDEAEKEGERIKKDKMYQAKEKYHELKQKHEQEVNNRNRKVEERERSIKQRDQQLGQQKSELKKKEQEVENIRENLNRQLELVTIKREEMEKAHQAHVSKLEQVAKLSKDEAIEELKASLVDEAKTRSMQHIKTIVEEANMKANKEAKKIVLQTIQRTAAEHAIENTVSVFNLKSDDQKGQIIGREGRNIRALEAETGVEIIVDDTPEAIIISGYDPVRREIARLSLQRLVADGRIHPARIEEVVAKTRKQLEEQIVEIGERTVIELGIHGLHPELVRMVGRMRFRSSYGQNLLQHSKEVANMCAIMASELGLNPKLAKRAGLLHDIGKVPEEETELSHALLGMKLCEKFGEHAAVVNAVGAHHDEVEMTYIISPIIQACDAISGARPGARRETMENYLQRIKDLENMALGFDGVEKCYAIQAGRELRVIVESEKVPDGKADELAFGISEKIQNEMQYPGQVKITVIRERRSISYAK